MSNSIEKLKPGPIPPGTKLAAVYYEFYKYIRDAIAREKVLKHWTRAQKIALIESLNPTWEELLID